MTEEREKQLVALVRSRTGQIRKSWSYQQSVAAARGDSELACRAYFVWRNARYHAGVDTSIPILAEVMVGHLGQEQIEDLESLSHKVALEYFGTDTGAAQEALEESGQ